MPDDFSEDVSKELVLSTADAVRKLAGYVVPEGSRRIRVVDQKGITRWRDLDDVLSTDTLSLSESTKMPVFAKGVGGRPPKAGSPRAQPKMVSTEDGEEDPDSELTMDDVKPARTPIVGDLLKLKTAMGRNDPIAQAVRINPESSDVLNQVVLAIAEEAASLRFERMEAERDGRESSHLSMRRVGALKSLGDTWIKRREQLDSQIIDIEGVAFGVLFQFISETFARAMEAAGVRQEQIDGTFSEFAKLLKDEWKNEAKSRMKKG